MRTTSLLGVFAILVWICPGIAGGASSSADSNLTTVDTRDEGLAVSGRVLHGITRNPLSGAAVSLAGLNASTASDGRFALSNIVLANGNVLAATRAGFVTNRQTVSAPAGARTVTMPDVLLSPTNGRPAITGIEPKFSGLFLAGVSLQNEYTASVDWSGQAPGRIEFSNGRGWMQSVNTTDTEAKVVLDVIEVFTPTFKPGGNVLQAVAVSQDGTRSDPFSKDVGLIPLPAALEWLAGYYPFTVYVTAQIGMDGSFPDPPIKGRVNLPVLGEFRVEVAANLSFDYTVEDGAWELALGLGAEGKQGKPGRRPKVPGLTRSPKLKLYVGNKEISGQVNAGAQGAASWSEGITLKQGSGHGEIKGKFELTRYGLLDLLGPGLSAALSKVPKLDQMTKNTSVMIWALPAIEGDVTWTFNPRIAFESMEWAGKFGLEASYEPNLGFGKARVYLGGEPSLTIQVPGDLLKELRFRVYAGFEAEIWIFNLGPVESVFLDYRYPSLKSMKGARPLGVGDVWLAPVVQSDANDGRLMRRGYLAAGLERFVTGESRLKSGAPATGSVLQNFRALGGRQPVGAVAAEEGGGIAGVAPKGAGAEPAVTNQADLTLVENCFPNSQAALAARGQELMMVYVADNGLSNTLQCTDIKWTRWDGANWSVPQAIRTNTQAEFAPQVAFDGNGDAVAVWQRVADPNFMNADITAMAAQMEIVWSRWSRAAGQWSEPTALTANSVLDHTPLLSGPMANGDLLAVWTRNEGNLVLGTNGPGADSVWWSGWNAAALTWTPPQALLTGLANRLSQSLAGTGGRAVYAWTADLDGVLTNESDQQLFFVEYVDGVWSTASQYDDDDHGNKNVRVAVDPAGNAYALWQQGTNLVLSRNWEPVPQVARADSQTAGFSDTALTVGPLGHVVVLWQEMSTNGSDAHYRVYDPASASWSSDDLLTQDRPLERSFAPVWDLAGNLTVAYNKVQVILTNKTVTVEGGVSVTITNVPQPGRVDLVVTKRALVKDAAVFAGDFTVDGNNYLPGDAVALSARVRNTGNVSISNAVVSFFDGNPDVGGTLISNVAVPGWISAASADTTASALWIVPEPAAPHTLYAVLDRVNALLEYNESNNVQFVNIGGTDLAVSLVSYAAERNGSVRVIAQVRNQGAPTATNTVLAIRRDGQSALLGAAAVPALEPGRLAQVALDLPSGTQPEGEQVYRLFADDNRVAPDTDTNNNTTVFAVNLWVDTDGDGMPDVWERQNGLNPADPADAGLDKDGDGVSNLAECRAGTDPRDPRSYLQLTSVSAGETNGVQIAWGSAANRLYSVLRCSALAANGGAFTSLVEHVLSTPPQNVFLDTTATNASQFFYRIKVEWPVDIPGTPPCITQQPVTQTVTAGSNVIFSVSASGSATVGFQWQRENVNISGETGSTLALNDVQLSSSGSYRVIVSNSAGSVTSQVAILTVTLPASPPTITQQPLSQTVNEGSDASFTVGVTGNPLPAYQWQFNGGDLTGAIEATLNLTNVRPAHCGNYAVVVSNSVGVVTSEVATLNAIPNGPPDNMVWIPGGTFVMGSPTNEVERGSDESQHPVTLSGFYMSRYEVTQREYLAVAGTNPSYFPGEVNRPVEQVTWYDATNYCHLLNVREGRLGSGWAYRLPTEAEWEYACRAGTTTPFHYGQNLLSGMASFHGKSEYIGGVGTSNNSSGILMGGTAAVGGYAPNGFGLYDMHGNVFEWCLDWYGRYPTWSVVNPWGPASGTSRVIRGGFFNYDARLCRAALRGSAVPDTWRGGFLGVRPVLAPEPPEPPLALANMVWIPGGTFVMGSPTNELERGSDETQHTVTLSGFYMSRFEVTQAEYLWLVGTNPMPYYTDDPNRPVMWVSKYDATNYCYLLNVREGRLGSGWEYRLPTESEWEYACRGGTTTPFHYGPDLLSGMANFYGKSEYIDGVGSSTNASGIFKARPTAVGSYAPNGFGLYDMHGNTAELCLDWYGTYPTGSVVNPWGPASGTNGVIRGGYFVNAGTQCRAARRNSGRASFRYSWVGMRLVFAQTPPCITQHPVTQTVTAGSNVIFSVSASGSATVGFQWQREDVNISGETGSTLALNDVQLSSSGSYRVIVSNSAGSVTSQVAILTVALPASPPTITQQPLSQTVNEGSDASFTVGVTGNPLPAYQWQFNGADLTGAIEATLNLTNVRPAHCGNYAVVVSNSVGVVTSEVATLNAIPNGPPDNMVWIPGGTFVMGSPTNEVGRSGDEAQHTVTLSGFYMSRYEVTQREYLAVVGSNPSYFKGDLNRPVEWVNSLSATNYCHLLNVREGRLGSSWQYRLPTESEWEYACRAGTTEPFHYGQNLLSGMANFVGTDEYFGGVGRSNNPSGVYLNRTTAVGSYAPNGFGLYDMHGNVWEWCLDWYGTYPTGSVANPRGPATGSDRVFRGGGWMGAVTACRSSERTHFDPRLNDHRVGFRPVLAPVQPGSPAPTNMVWIPGGTFVMGSPTNEVGRWGVEVQYTVTVSGFHMSRYEVTQREYLAVVGTNPSYFPGDLNRPVEQATWYDATNYCHLLNLREGRLGSSWQYRLPTESEWEYACRAGTTTPFHYGPDLLSGMANFCGRFEYIGGVGTSNNPSGVWLYRTTAVGSYAPNAWGLYDMHGNVGEWCLDWYGAYPMGSVANPRGSASGSYRVVRGGGWHDAALNCRAAFRGDISPGYRGWDYGFRVVLAPLQP